MSSGSRTIPIVEHLRCQHSIEEEPRDKPVQNKLVIDLLQRRVDPRQTPKQVVKHGKGRQLARPTLAIHSQDLRQLARNAQRPSTSLQRRHLRLADQRVRHHQRVHGTADGRDECTGLRAPPRIHEDQHADHDVLHGDQARLAVRAEREFVADVVRERDHEARGFEEVAAEGEALGRLGRDELEDLRHFHHGRRADDADPEGLGDRERHAFRVWREVEVQEECAVARFAQQVDGEGVQGARQIGRDGEEVRLERVEDELLELVHFRVCLFG